MLKFISVSIKLLFLIMIFLGILSAYVEENQVIGSLSTFSYLENSVNINPVSRGKNDDSKVHLEPVQLVSDFNSIETSVSKNSRVTNLGYKTLEYQVPHVKVTNRLNTIETNNKYIINKDLIYKKENYQEDFVPGKVIVAYKKGHLQSASLLKQVGVESRRELAVARDPENGIQVFADCKLILMNLEDSTKESVLRAINILKKDPNIAYVQPDYIYEAAVTPDDVDFNKLYAMHNTGQTGGTVDSDIDAIEAWDKFSGSGEVLVGVVDTGIDYTHPDLVDNIWTNFGEIADNGLDDDGNGYIDDIHGWDFAYNDNDPVDGNGHGTHCSGTIAAVGNNGIGVAGVNWQASLVALKFLNDSGRGSTSTAVDAISYANAMGIPITSNSWGGGAYDQALKDVISDGGLFITAAGNSSSNNDINPNYPSNFDNNNIIAVAAADHNDNLASFSNYGAISVDLAAPGVDIYSTVPGADYNYYSGTSMAVPHVSGAAALILGYNPSLSTEEIKEILLGSIDYVEFFDGLMLTAGRLNTNNALNMINTW